MKLTLSCCLSASLLSFISGAVAASSITYSVVGLPSSDNTEFGVLIDGNDIYRLSPSKEDATILFQVDAPIAQKKYSFVELDKNSDDIVNKEKFERDPINSQINQVYGRSWTTKSVKTFERVYDEVGARQKTDLHPADEIPALHIEADQKEIDRIHEDYNQKIKVKADLTFIGAYGIKKFSNVKFNIAGRSSRFEDKPSYNIKLAKGDDLGGYRSLKLKSSTADPSFLRNKMSFDMMIAAGLPGTRLSYKRVYLNNVALGLFIFSENYDDTWFNINANPGVSNYKNGVLYEGTGSVNNFPGEFTDLKYISDKPEVYGESGYNIALEDKSSKKKYSTLSEFTKFIDVQLKSPASNNTDNEKEVVAEWGKYLGVEIFLRSMAFEFLNTAWDNYLAWGDNYFIYKCPILHYFVWISWDMESSFGNSPYSKSVQLEGDYRHVEGFQNRPLTKAVFRVPSFRKYFESALEKIVHSIYDPRISFPVIDSLTKLLKEDVEWDKSVPKINADKDFENPPKGDSKEGKTFENTPTTLPKNTDKQLLKELKDKNRRVVDFQKIIDGPTPYGSLMGLKEFIQGKYDNVNKHI